MKSKINILNLLLASTLLACSPWAAGAAGAMSKAENSQASTIQVQTLAAKYNFDGRDIALPAGAYTFIYKGATYVPVRFVGVALQRNVQWDNKLKKLTVSAATEAQKVILREQLMNAVPRTSTGTGMKSVHVTPLTVKYFFDGVTKQLPAGQVSFIYGGTLYVPLRFVSEAVGLKITWDAGSKTITSKSAPDVQGQPPSTDNGTSGGGNTTAPPVNTGGSAPGGTTPGDSGYKSITSAAEAKLEELHNRSQSELMALGLKYVTETDAAEKARLKKQGQNMLDGYKREFESIVSEAESKLVAGGYSTDIIKQYRDKFNQEMEAGRHIADNLGG